MKLEFKVEELHSAALSVSSLCRWRSVLARCLAAPHIKRTDSCIQFRIQKSISSFRTLCQKHRAPLVFHLTSTSPVRRRILCADGEGSRLVGEHHSSGKKVKKDVCCDASEFSLWSVRLPDVLTLYQLLPVSRKKGRPRSSSQNKPCCCFFSLRFAEAVSLNLLPDFFFPACVCRSRPIFWHAEPELNRYGPLPGAHPVFPLTRAPFNRTPPFTEEVGENEEEEGTGVGGRSLLLISGIHR